MSEIRQLIEEYDQKLRAANTARQYSSVLNLLNEFRRSVRSMTDCSINISEFIAEAIDSTKRFRIDLWLSAAYMHPSVDYVDNLCRLLDLKDKAIPNEMIVEILCLIPSQRSVKSLLEACLNPLLYDPSEEFGIKCLDALAAINTPDAWQAIGSLQGSSSPLMAHRINELLEWVERGQL